MEIHSSIAPCLTAPICAEALLLAYGRLHVHSYRTHAYFTSPLRWWLALQATVCGIRLLVQYSTCKFISTSICHVLFRQNPLASLTCDRHRLPATKEWEERWVKEMIANTCGKLGRLHCYIPPSAAISKTSQLGIVGGLFQPSR